MNDMRAFILLSIMLPFALSGNSAGVTSGIVMATMEGADFKIPSNQVATLEDNEQCKRLAVRLADWVSDLKIEQAAKEMNIKVSEADQIEYLQKARGNVDEQVSKLRELVKILPEALREAKRNPGNEMQIYHDHVSGLISYNLWRGHLRAYTSDEKYLENIEKAPQPTRAMLVQPNPVVKSVVLKRKLRDLVTKDTSVTEVEIRQAFEKAKLTNDFLSVRGEIEESIIRSKKEKYWNDWIRSQQKVANVHISDERLKNAFDQIVKEGGAEAGTFLLDNQQKKHSAGD